MKKISFFLSLMLVCSVFTGCYYDDTDIKNAFDDYKTEQDSINIKTAEEQSEALAQTLLQLEELEATIREYLNDSLSVEFQNEINSLKAQIIALKNSDDSVKTWVETTYTTLEQYNELSLLLSATKDSLLAAMGQMDSTLRADITIQINSLEASMQTWVSEKLQGYYTIEEVDSMLQVERTNYATTLATQDSILHAALDSINTALRDSIQEVNTSLLDSIALLRVAIQTNQTNIDSLRVQLTREYQAFVSSAIEEYDGQIKGYVKNQLDSLNANITASIDSLKQDIVQIKDDIEGIKSRLDAIESRLDDIGTTIDNILNQIQTVTYLPQYTDGIIVVSRSISKMDTIYDEYKNLVRVDTTFSYSCEPIEFLITPSSCVAAIEQTMLSVKILNQSSRMVHAINANPDSSLEIELTDTDSEKGIIQIKLKDTETLRLWYVSEKSSSLALFIDDETTNTHANSGFVVPLQRKDNF